MACESSISFPMNGGDGMYSYARNSSYQRGGVETTKALINEAITEKLDWKQLMISSSNVFRVADLGCSIGPNTFIAVKNIIESVMNKYKPDEPESKPLEFQVFFNDHPSNDFNTLFESLPENRTYFAAGVPGFFQGRLFPKASLHFVHSSYAVQWLPEIPSDLVDDRSPAWNKGRIHYATGPCEVVEAFSAHFAKCVKSFLNARAEEIVHGGLMAILIPCLPDGIPPSQCSLLIAIDLLGACLMDMANSGLVSEAKVDSFNIPKYYPTPEEFKSLLEKNASFSVVRIEPVVRFNNRQAAASNAKMLNLHFRAVYEGLIKEHFGSHVIEELFDRFTEKVVESVNVFVHYRPTVDFFFLLQRNTT